MKQTRFTTNQVTNLTGFGKAALTKFAAAELVAPKSNGTGRGIQRTWDVPNVVALAMAREMLDAGWEPEAVRPVIRLLANMSHTEVVRTVDSGSTILVSPFRGGVWCPMEAFENDPAMSQSKRDYLERVDLKNVYSRVMRAALTTSEEQ